MKRSLTFRALLACAALAAVAYSAFSHVADTVVATCRAVKNFAFDQFMLAVNTVARQEPSTGSAVWFARAGAFVARIVKRERPVVESSWRMCPSV